VPQREVLFEGLREEEILEFPKETVEQLILLGEPIVFRARDPLTRNRPGREEPGRMGGVACILGAVGSGALVQARARTPRFKPERRSRVTRYRALRDKRLRTTKTPIMAAPETST
jgi:hypothetical protein